MHLKNELALSTEIKDELLDAFMSVPLGMSRFQIENFVLNHGSPERQRRQVILELRSRYLTLQTAEFARRRKRREIAVLEEKIANGEGDRVLNEIDIEEIRFNLATDEQLIAQTLIEAQTFWNCYQSLPSFTMEEFEAAERDYWGNRLITEANYSMIATGAPDLGSIGRIAEMGGDPVKMVAGLRSGLQKQTSSLELPVSL